MSAISVESEASEINIQSGPKSKPSSFLVISASNIDRFWHFHSHNQQ